MLLQGTKATERPQRTTGVIVTPVEPEKTTAPEPEKVEAHVYPPLTWPKPTVGQVLAEGLGGMSKAVLIMVIVGAVLIGVAMGAAIVLSGVVHGLGFDPSGGY
ncbi:hypothetical protein [Paractinoplanes atraurantiacus]|uniref:Uncharacterized protein n=1 Tax=Paractinoplanes atraurantiacus TaxID=1036182 RepID=A0A285HTA5_9ACTN|nr:hypothetical protein [Actinoplanes atraurantiacus]SNY38932.1 hypothetical protein SAMN05421748_105285 [Actinoplanes atraurantiacus]